MRAKVQAFFLKGNYIFCPFSKKSAYICLFNYKKHGIQQLQKFWTDFGKIQS